MSYFIRLIDYSIVDFFVQQAEGFRYCRDQFLEHAPYLLCGGKLHSFFADFPEEATYSLVVAEPSGHRKDVILEKPCRFFMPSSLESYTCET